MILIWWGYQVGPWRFEKSYAQIYGEVFQGSYVIVNKTNDSFSLPQFGSSSSSVYFSCAATWLMGERASTHSSVKNPQHYLPVGNR
mmetsp:Transcript_4092/g.9191  ORF Transcript_4092/g.9191 Transcript_4092/m.9191 type:complete len:86 (+) Transcript_4092:29-286(+)